MKNVVFALLLGTALFAADKPQTYTGVVTDTMCGAKHTMGATSDAKCVRECVKMDKNTKYALLVGKNVYVLSDQQAGDKYAAQKVVVTGTLDAANKTLKVDKIAAAK